MLVSPMQPANMNKSKMFRAGGHLRAGGPRRAFPLVAMSSFLVPLSPAADLEFSLVAAADNGQLGSAFAVVADRDDDGVSDFAVSDPGYRSGGSLFGSGIVYVVSGTDGSVIESYEGAPASSQSFGAAVAALDADGDGITDLAVGAPGHADASGFGAGAVWIYSGADGALLRQVVGASSSQFGSALAPAGDPDGDGIEDLYVGAPRANGSRGALELVSPADGSVRWSMSPVASTSSFAVELAAVGDVDADGRPDVAVGAPDFRDGGNPVGRVALIGSADQSLLAQRVGSGFFNRLGTTLAGVEDVDGDGLGDVLVGSYSGGTCLALSGADLGVLRDLSIPTLSRYQRLTAGGSLQYDDDGEPDWLIGSPGFAVDGYTPYGGFRIVSGADGSVLFESLSDVANSGLGASLEILPGFGFAAGETGLADPLSGGFGLADFWRVEVVSDSDGDGIPDDEDAVPESIVDPVVMIGGEDSGVENRIDEDGVSLADRLDSAGTPEELGNAGRYVSGFNQLLRDLETSGLISRDEARALRLAAVASASRRPSR